MIRLFTLLITLCAVTISTPAYADNCDSHDKKEAKAEDAKAEDAKAADAKAEHKGCTGCAKGKSGESAWCDGCKKGFVDGKAVKCKTCFEHKANKGEECKDEACKKKAEGDAKEG